MTFQTPILLIGFNRPAQIEQSLKAILSIKPSQLFIALDGPRAQRADDVDSCAQVKNVISRLLESAPYCTIHTLYRKQNLGCGKGVSGAISWFFSHVEAGIIIEDDVVADPSFFTYSQQLLKKYATDTRIMAITGRNVAGMWKTPAKQSYFFSSTLNVWGWATWKRAWNLFDFDMKDWPIVRSNSRFYDGLTAEQQILTKKAYDKMYRHELDTWDYQWGYALQKHKGLTIIPRVNLVSNVGFGATATHTKVENPAIESVPVHQMTFPLRHPKSIVADHTYYIFFLSLAKPSLFHRLTRALWVLFHDPKGFCRLVWEKL
jgi:hypothetical protein